VRLWEIGLGLLAGLLLAWLALAGALVAVRPRGGALAQAVRLLPDLLRLVARLARDRTLPAGVRVRLALLGLYLALPFDLIPDFVPVIGYADDAILVAGTLRSVVRHAGVDAVRRHWPGTDDGFAALLRLVSYRPARWLTAAWLLALLAALTAALARGWLLGVDLAVAHWSDTHRPLWTSWAAKVLNYTGQGTPLTLIALGLAVLYGWRRHTVRPLLPVAAGFLATYLTVGPMKLAFHRAPPHNQNQVAHPERLFSDPHSVSYPSGHATNAIVWYWVLALLLTTVLSGRWRVVLRVVPPAVTCVMTTYLGYHWLTDTVAGLLLGVALGELLGLVRWDAVPLGGWLGRRGWAGPAGLDATAGRPSAPVVAGRREP
jgi:uncharacterized membrane protein YkvA (DUF1232 family)